MDIKEEKANTFIAHLIKNPSLQGFTPLQKEEQLFQFITQNGSQLFPTLSSVDFFPGESWESIHKLLAKAIYFQINKDLLDKLKLLIDSKINFTFLQFFRQQQISADKIKEMLLSFFSRILKKLEVRHSFTGSYGVLAFNYADLYMDEIFHRRKYIYFELTKVQRLRMGKEEMKNMLKTSVLLRPLIYLTISNIPQLRRSENGLVPVSYADKVAKMIMTLLPYIPEPVIKSAAHSNLSFVDNRFIESTARLTLLLTNRCQLYNPQIKTDRGANTPDKSWYSIARKNFKFYGYDIKMVDELYNIASENGW